MLTHTIIWLYRICHPVGSTNKLGSNNISLTVSRFRGMSKIVSLLPVQLLDLWSAHKLGKSVMHCEISYACITTKILLVITIYSSFHLRLVHVFLHTSLIKWTLHIKLCNIYFEFFQLQPKIRSKFNNDRSTFDMQI